MKLKYYLRGLGIGMIVTALILGISFSHRQGQETQTLTDDQIRERAEQLGMVDSSELTLAALQNSVQQQAQENTEKTEASAAGYRKRDWWKMRRHLTIIYVITATAAA